MVYLGKEPKDSSNLNLPCGKCMGCMEGKAKEWALRCELEATQHQSAVFVTLTYNDENLPPTLSKKHLALFIRRLRKRLARQKPARTIRFFASGEYGEKTNRPHYHAILFGASMADEKTIQETWARGNTLTVNSTAAAMAYTAGYTAKKYGDENKHRNKLISDEAGEAGYGHINVDKATGEVLGYYWQKPFLQMSNKPGIGAHAKKYRDSWKDFAVRDGKKQGVPRYYQEHWKKTATPAELRDWKEKREELMKKIQKTEEQRKAEEQIAKAKKQQKQDRRKL